MPAIRLLRFLFKLLLSIRTIHLIAQVGMHSESYQDLCEEQSRTATQSRTEVTFCSHRIPHRDHLSPPPNFTCQ